MTSAPPVFGINWGLLEYLTSRKLGCVTCSRGVARDWRIVIQVATDAVTARGNEIFTGIG